MKKCSVAGCDRLGDRLANDQRMCTMHVRRWLNHGDPLVSMRGHRPRRDPLERFLEKVSVDASGCWPWVGALKSNGYGSFRGVDHTVVHAHRFSYELFVGPIPEGLALDHLCRVRHCVNPDHLEPVTARENGRRGLLGEAKTHCAQGHPYDGDNVYVSPRGWRSCRACRSASRAA